MTDFTRVQDAHARAARAERILDAAAELLLRWGYKRVTVDDVAAQAGVGKGTIYLHWQTREALFYAVIARDMAAAVDELVAAVRDNPEAAMPSLLMPEFFLVVMRRPLVQALFVSDLEILGKLAKGADKALEAQQDKAFYHYLQVLAEHGLVRTDIADDELFYAFGATVAGFFLTDVLASEQFQLAPERKAASLSTTVRLAFEAAGPPPGAVRAVAPRVIEIFADVAERYRAHVRRAYE